MFFDFINKDILEEDKVDVVVPESVKIYAGNTLILKPTSKTVKDFKIISMESMDQSIATVNNSYIIAENVGETQINTEVEANGKSYNLVTSVTVMAGELSVKSDIKTMSVGETMRLKAMVSYGVYKDIRYRSTNLNIATVTKKGICGYVTGLSKGNVDIIVSANIGNVIREKRISLTVENFKNKPIPISNPVNGSNYTANDEWKGSRVFFGSYEQDNNISNGKEPILWRVLEVKDDTIFLLSEYGLICKFYNDIYDSVTWETSTIRKWLNNDFLDQAFLKTEIDAIYDTPLKTNNIKKYGSSGGNKTIDKVFLLSNKDVNNTAYGFQKGSRYKSKARALQVTDYAEVEGYRNKNNGNTCWWLRSPGITNYHAAYVLTSGKVTYSHFVGRRNDAIRPAIKLKRSSIIFGDEICDGKYSGPMIIVKDA